MFYRMVSLKVFSFLNFVLNFVLHLVLHLEVLLISNFVLHLELEQEFSDVLNHLHVENVA